MDFFSRGAVQLLLAIVSVIWLVPTIGLLIASLRPETANTANGWWNAFTKPAQFTFDNYNQILHNSTITSAFMNTIYITVPATLLVVGISSLAAYAFSWMDFPGRDWSFLLVVSLLVVPLQSPPYPL